MSTRTASVDVGEFRGRYKHLGELAAVFKHRNGTWRDFGEFLEFLFCDSSSGLHVREIECRHNYMGRHHATLLDAAAHPENYPMFDHPRFSRPCISMGSYDERKAPGLVVHSLCKKAQEFLLSIGKGDPGGYAGRDFDFEPAPSSPLEPPGDSQKTDSQGAIDSANIVEGCRVVPQPASSPGDLLEEFDGDELFDDADIQSELDALWGTTNANQSSRAPSNLEISEEGGSGDSLLQSEARSSTKMRSHTLAYLWGFCGEPLKLRDEFRRLRTQRELCVLHLCGCGICYQPSPGVRVAGCVEHSHLRLGTSAENDDHRQFHAMINFARVSDYPSQCGIIHRAGEHGQGIF